jgi:NADH dehydrogenase
VNHQELTDNDEVGRLLITGANGRLGRRLIERLARLTPPIPVRAVVRSEQAAKTLAALPEAIRPETIVLDYADTEKLTEAARGCRYAVHLVGILKESPNSRYEDAHEASARSLAQAATAAGLRRVVCLSIIGSGPESKNACLASKGRAEQILLDSKTPALILRVGMVLGPGDPAARGIRKQSQARFLPLVAGGGRRNQPIYCNDVVEAMVAALSRGGLDDLILNLAGPESIPHRDLVHRVAALNGHRPIIIPIPYGLVHFSTTLSERFNENPPMTTAAFEVIHGDDHVDPEPAREKLGIELTSLDEMLRLCIEA